MGEQNQKNGFDSKDSSNNTLPQANNPTENQEQDEDINEDDLTPEEFQHLDNQLDALLSALDDIESKNDNIHSQLLELLHANREIRKQLMEENQKENVGDMDTK